MHTLFFLLFARAIVGWEEKMDTHVSYLEQVCRIGGRKFSSCKQPIRYSVRTLKDELQSVFSLDVENDSYDIHPQHICILCQRALKRACSKPNPKEAFCGGGCGPLKSWEAHKRNNCGFCESQSSGAKGKSTKPAKPKQKLRGAVAKWGDETPTTQAQAPMQEHVTPEPSSVSGLDIPLEQVIENACKLNQATVKLQPDRFIDKHAIEQCHICHNVVDNAIEAACCQELFCTMCICTWLENSSQCPVCGDGMRASSLRQPGRVLSRIIENWSLHCDYHQPHLQGCPEIVPLSKLQDHVAQCPFNPEVSTQPIRTLRPSSTVSDALTASPSKLRGDVAGSLTSHLVTARAQDGCLQIHLSNHGKPQIYKRTSTSSVPSGEASARTQRRRTQELSRIAESVCGGEMGARAQEVAGLKRLSSSEQEQLLVDAGLRSFSPAAGTALAIKADLSLPWTQLRKLRCWLKEFGVRLEPEQSIRSFIATKLPSYVAKELPMTDKTGVVTMAAAVFIPNMIEVVSFYLERLSDEGTLTWHDGAIPESEIWLKVGGDHGGGSFKLSFQIVNVPKPNAITNTVPLCIFNAKDTPANLETALAQYRPQILELQKSAWRGKSYRLFLFGDYEFQTNNYGLSGAAGVRPCLHCLCTKTELAYPMSNRLAVDQRERTLDMLAGDLQHFTAAGAKVSQAKRYNNVIRPCILPIEISNAIIPVLHLDLGIFPWMFSAFLRDLKQLDLAIVAKCDPTDDDNSNFRKLCLLHKELQSVEMLLSTAQTTVASTQQQLEFVTLHMQQHADTEDLLLGVANDLQNVYQRALSEKQQHSNTIQETQQKISKLSGSKEFSGPCVASVEPVLQQHNIQRQVYHGGAFIGNHINQALKPTVVTAISQAHVPVVQERCAALLNEANVISQRYQSLLSQYAACRVIFSHSKPITDLDIEQLSAKVQSFLELCRREVVERQFGNITPKLHLLENHTEPMMRRLRVGLGLLGEQGAESLHSSLSSLASKFKNIPGELQRLKAVADQHLLTTTDEASKLRPRPRKRKASD